MDVDPGIDFVEAIETNVGSCDVLIAVIGKRWLRSSVKGKRRLENSEDFVRVEIATALKEYPSDPSSGGWYFDASV